jgi:ABC-type nitrate/sulfonate/bicarbonate transport system substrate-binding protein
MSKSSSIVSMLFALVAAIITMFGFADPSAAQAPAKKVNVRLGWQPLSGGSAMP